MEEEEKGEERRAWNTKEARKIEAFCGWVGAKKKDYGFLLYHYCARPKWQSKRVVGGSGGTQEILLQGVLKKCPPLLSLSTKIFKGFFWGGGSITYLILIFLWVETPSSSMPKGIVEGGEGCSTFSTPIISSFATGGC